LSVGNPIVLPILSPPTFALYKKEGHRDKLRGLFDLARADHLPDGRRMNDLTVQYEPFRDGKPDLALSRQTPQKNRCRPRRPSRT
jgi:hypothetical protein